MAKYYSEIKKALEHCIENNCVNCPNDDELGSGDIICRARLLPKVLVYITELESKLAEKDKEIKQLKLDLGMFKSVNEFINNYGIDKAREVLLQTEKTKHQDKIEFVVEQLEKVKETLIQNADEIGEEYKEDYFMISLGNVKNIIDNKIKQLKEGK